MELQHPNIVQVLGVTELPVSLGDCALLALCHNGLIVVHDCAGALCQRLAEGFFEKVRDSGH